MKHADKIRKAAVIIRKHYNLDRPVTEAEVLAEVESLSRNAGHRWFDTDYNLAAALGRVVQIHPVTGQVDWS